MLTRDFTVALRKGVEQAVKDIRDVFYDIVSSYENANLATGVAVHCAAVDLQQSSLGSRFCAVMCTGILHQHRWRMNFQTKGEPYQKIGTLKSVDSALRAIDVDFKAFEHVFENFEPEEDHRECNPLPKLVARSWEMAENTKDWSLEI